MAKHGVEDCELFGLSGRGGLDVDGGTGAVAVDGVADFGSCGEDEGYFGFGKGLLGGGGG